MKPRFSSTSPAISTLVSRNVSRDPVSDQFSSAAPQHSTLLSIVAPSRLTPPRAAKPWRSSTAPPITAFSAASATPVPSGVALVRLRAVAFQVAADPGADQADRTLRGEAVAQQHGPTDHRMVRRQSNAGAVGGRVGQAGAVAFQAAGDPRAAHADAALGREPVAQQHRAADLRGIRRQYHAAAVLRAVHQSRRVHVERAGDARAHQPDHAGGDEPVAQDHDAVEARRLAADRVALAGADPCTARDHVPGHVRGVQRHPADRGELAEQVQAAADRRPRQAQRIACIAMCDAGARRRDLQEGAAAQQVALDHRGMRIDPGGFRQGGDA